jgi:hypothetical protein
LARLVPSFPREFTTYFHAQAKKNRLDGKHQDGSQVMAEQRDRWSRCVRMSHLRASAGGDEFTIERFPKGSAPAVLSME